MIKPMKAAEARKIQLQSYRSEVSNEMLEYALSKIKETAERGGWAILMEDLLIEKNQDHHYSLGMVLCNDYGHRTIMIDPVNLKYLIAW